MAEIKPTESTVGNWTLFTWSSVTENDTFGVAPLAGASGAATLQVTGAFGGATVIAQGSNDNSNFVGLTDPGGTAVSLTAAGGAELRYPWPYMRPSASGGSSQSLAVVLAVLG